MWFIVQALLGHDRDYSVVSAPDAHTVDSIVNKYIRCILNDRKVSEGKI